MASIGSKKAMVNFTTRKETSLHRSGNMSMLFAAIKINIFTGKNKWLILLKRHAQNAASA